MLPTIRETQSVTLGPRPQTHTHTHTNCCRTIGEHSEIGAQNTSRVSVVATWSPVVVHCVVVTTIDEHC